MLDGAPLTYGVQTHLSDPHSLQHLPLLPTNPSYLWVPDPLDRCQAPNHYMAAVANGLLIIEGLCFFFKILCVCACVRAHVCVRVHVCAHTRSHSHGTLRPEKAVRFVRSWSYRQL